MIYQYLVQLINIGYEQRTNTWHYARGVVISVSHVFPFAIEKVELRSWVNSYIQLFSCTTLCHRWVFHFLIEAEGLLPWCFSNGFRIGVYYTCHPMINLFLVMFPTNDDLVPFQNSVAIHFISWICCFNIKITRINMAQ